MSSQIPLPLQTTVVPTRANFIVCGANAAAAALIESWPAWTVPVVALYGPSGSGKSHLVEIWKAQSGAQYTVAAALSGSAFAQLDRRRPIAIENVDSSLPNPARDAALFHLLESATIAAPLLLTGREIPSAWHAALPDLKSRFSALVSLSLWAPDDELLTKLARKLFEDRQIAVPDAVIERMIQSLERSPTAIQDFVSKVDTKALAEKKPVTIALIREILAGCAVD